MPIAEVGPKVFLSYRRVDTGPAVRAISTILMQAFGPHSVFLDHEGIRGGDKWPARIDHALESAEILLVALGPAWLRVADEYGRRRIDQPNDWVRTEVARSLERGIHVIPLLIGRAAMPEPAGLPDCLVGLRDHQAYELRDEYWQQDAGGLIERLAHLGCTRVAAAVDYPNPHNFPQALSDDELNDALTRLDQWVLTESVIPGQESKTRTELMKCYKFDTFEQAMAFMQSAVPFISDMDHHPRWENIYVTVTVWLTSFDIGFKPSRSDLELAQHLDALQRAARSK
jgi:pterin-4a-carbinolamine dehydratase